MLEGFGYAKRDLDTERIEVFLLLEEESFAGQFLLSQPLTESELEEAADNCTEAEYYAIVMAYVT